MKTLAFCVLVLAVVVGCEKSPEPASVATEQSPAAEEAKPAPEAAKDVPPALAEIFEKQNQLHKRQTGALLTINAKWEKGEKTEEAIVVDWQIDYNGPRHPFTIHTPGSTLSRAVGTTIHVWYIRPDGKSANFEYGYSTPSGPLPPIPKGMFSIAADGKPIFGKFHHGRSSLKQYLDHEPWPGKPRLWVQMEYTTNHRGDGVEQIRNPDTLMLENGAPWTLDAWTGKLWSKVVEVAIK